MTIMTGTIKVAPGIYSVKHDGIEVFVTEDQLTRKRKGLDFFFSDTLHSAIEFATTGVTENVLDKTDKGEKYMVTIRNRKTGESIKVDVYDVLEAFEITCSAMAHAIKKLLMPGKRGSKGYDKDCDEAINSVEQSKLLQKYRE